jgi:hypothetical protein
VLMRVAAHTMYRRILCNLKEDTRLLKVYMVVAWVFPGLWGSLPFFWDMWGSVGVSHVVSFLPCLEAKACRMEHASKVNQGLI